MSWETGAGKSYLIPALEIPAFLLLLNRYDRFAYPNDLENGGKKSTAREPLNLLGPRRQRVLGCRHGRLQNKSVRASVSGVHVPSIHAVGGPKLLGVAPLHPTLEASYGKRAVRPRTPPLTTRSAAALAGASSVRRSSGWPAWCLRAMAANRVMARAGSGGDFATHRYQSPCLWKPVQARIPEP